MRWPINNSEGDVKLCLRNEGSSGYPEFTWCAFLSLFLLCLIIVASIGQSEMHEIPRFDTMSNQCGIGPLEKYQKLWAHQIFDAVFVKYCVSECPVEGE